MWFQNLKFEFIFIKYDSVNKNIRKYIFKTDLFLKKKLIWISKFKYILDPTDKFKIWIKEFFKF